MFDISQITTPLSVFATAKNISGPKAGLEVKYVEKGKKIQKHFNNHEEVARWARQKGLKLGNPWDTGVEDEYSVEIEWA